MFSSDKASNPRVLQIMKILTLGHNIGQQFLRLYYYHKQPLLRCNFCTNKIPLKNRLNHKIFMLKFPF